MPMAPVAAPVLLLLLAGAAAAAAAAPFLAGLPLEVVQAWPSELQTGGSITVADRLAFTVGAASCAAAASAGGDDAAHLPPHHRRSPAAAPPPPPPPPPQAVFSRPVIALGSDFGAAALPAALSPFTVDCPGVPGALRWVTTNIARWDPAINWPTDLDCAVTWNVGLKTFDGAPLALGGAPRSVRLRSAPLKLEVAAVDSAGAAARTEGQWNAYRGMADDELPEVPPDANVTLTFNYPVALAALEGALEVAPCCGSAAGAGQRVSVLPCGAPYVVVDPFAPPAAQAAQRANATCAVVRLSPGLPAGGSAILRLRRGARYNAVSGPVANSTDVYLHGLRRFRVPLRDNFQQLANATEQFNYLDNGISYRRLTLWLPHGLAPGVPVSALARRVSLCRYAAPYDWASACAPEPFTLTVVNRGQLLLTAPGLRDRQHYRIRVAADPGLKDGYGLPLEGSEAFFFTTQPAQDLAFPRLASGSQARRARGRVAAGHVCGRARARAPVAALLVDRAAADDAGQVMLLEPSPTGAPLVWPVVFRGAPQYDGDARGVATWPVSASQPLPALRVLGGADKPAQLEQLLRKPAQSVPRTFSALTADASLLLSGKPGLQLVGCPTNSSWDGLTNTVLLATSDLQYAGVSLGSRLTHFVTLTSAGAAPVPGAKVSLFLLPYGDPPLPGPTCTTGAGGACTVDTKALLTSGTYGTLTALVEAPGHGPLVVWAFSTPSYYEDESLQYPYVGQLVVDRLLVMPGDTLHVTGFLQERGGLADRLSLPAGLGSVGLSVQPPFVAGPDAPPLALTAPVNASYGTFHANIPVPAGAKPGEFTVTLTAPRTRPGAPAPAKGSDGPAELASVTFTVGTPRPPTALLNVTVPDWAPPGATVEVLIAASSYLGATVSGADVSLTWTVPRATGRLTVTTDTAGKARAAIPLGALPPANATELGDTLGIVVEWVGPTRERVVERESVRIANGPVRVELARSPVADVPGVPFIVAASTWLNDRDGTQLEGVTVEVSLAPNASDSLADCPAPARAALAAQRCRVVSGRAPAAPPCTLSLPCAADLKIVACPLSFANGTAIAGAGGGPGCSETPVGRNASAWASSPWASLPELALLRDRQNYSVGDTATLSWVNPGWRTARGLLVWGNARLQRQRELPAVAPGPGSAAVPLGEECLGGCTATLVLALPRPGGDAATAVAAKAAVKPLSLGLPASKLFDPLSPSTASASVQLDVHEDNRLNVTVRVVPRGSTGTGGGLFRAVAEGPDGRAVPVMRPGTDADIEVTVTEVGSGKPAADAEVTLVVVDEAILALMPYPLVVRGAAGGVAAALPRAGRLSPRRRHATTELPPPPVPHATQDVAADLVNYPAVQSFVKEINDYRTTRADIQTTFDTLKRRLAADPWLPLVTTVSPSPYADVRSWGSRSTYPVASAVDTPDVEYVRGFSNPLTVTPFYTWGLSQRYPAGSRGPGEPGAALRLSSEFVTTPLFTAVTTGADGAARARFAAPPNLGTFTVRAYAASSGSRAAPSKYGANETAVVVRQPLSLTLSTPASVRVGDDFEAGVLVSAPDAAAPVEVEITASVEAPASEDGAGAGAGASAPANATAAPRAGGRRRLRAAAAAPSSAPLVLLPAGSVSQRVTVSPAQQQVEVRFRFAAKAMGASGLRFVARVPGLAGAAPSPPKERGAAAASAGTLRPLSFNVFGLTINLGGPRGGASAQPGAGGASGGGGGGAAGAATTAGGGGAGAAQLGGGGWVADQVQGDVAVLGQQGAVFLATSFALSAGTNGSGRAEGLVLPDAAPGSGTVQLIAGVGNLPAIKANYDALTDRQAAAAAAAADGGAPFTPSGPDALSAALLPAFLARYAPSPAAMLASVGKPGALASAAQLNASAAAAAVAAGKLTQAGRGLSYSAVDPSDPWQPAPSVALNAWATWLTDQASAPPAAGLQGLAYGGALRGASAAWKKAAAEQLVKDAQAARHPPAPVNAAYKPETEPPRMYMDFGDLSWARLALGPSWAPPAGVAADVASDLSLRRLLAAAEAPGNTTVGTQARTGLALLAAAAAGGGGGLTSAEARVGADKLGKALLGALRVSGRTAYVAAAPAAAEAAGAEDQALALALLAAQRQPGAADLLPRLAAYVAGGGAGVPRGGATPCASVGGTATGTVAAALSAYDAARGSTRPDAKLTVTAVGGAGSAGAGAGGAGAAAAPAGGGAAQLLSASFAAASGAAPALASATTPWSALPSAPALRFEVSGTAGEVSVAAGLSFTPAALLPFPSFRGLWVERVVAAEDGSGNLGSAALADVVTVAVQLTSPDAIPGGVVVEVSLPGGLEPIDPAVYKDAGAAAQCDLGGGRFGGWWCPAQSTARSAVTFTFTSLGAGTASLSFKAIAATPGVFVLPPVKAYAVAAPEIMGLSAAGQFTVCPSRRGANAAAATAAVAPTPGAAAFPGCATPGATRPPLPAARPCPANCNGNGVCDLARGQRAGGVRYNARTLVGNWNAELAQQDAAVADFAASAAAGSLRLDRHAQRLATALAPVRLTAARGDGCVHFGDVVQLAHAQTGALLAVNVEAREQHGRPSCAASGAAASTGTAARTTLSLAKAVPCTPAPLEPQWADDVLHFGQKVRLVANAAAQVQPVEPADQAASEGVAVASGEPVLLLHAATRAPLHLERGHVLPGQDFGGVEHELSCHAAATGTGKQLALEHAARGDATRTLPKRCLSDVHWVFVTGDCGCDGA
ncbi:hypothetical protein HT031_001946 [Scenedesmus sp. PABB004]|nr:hypothetical protein HT031_001946 [Scenedesmus sp. PABB004]